MTGSIAVRKTYKLYIGGKFPRSESGRTLELTDATGRFWANIALASRKDLREAVLAASGAQPGWAAATPYLRGQILYRVAEVLAGRVDQFAAELVSAGEAADTAVATELVGEAIDRWVWYAGWADKLAQVAGTVNPVAGPFLNISRPEPVGVVGALCPDAGGFSALANIVPSILVGGNSVVLVVPPRLAPVAITLAETLATSDVPGGVVNVLTGSAAELGPWLAGHETVDALDLSGALGAEAPGATLRDLEILAARTLTRVYREPTATPGAAPDWRAEPLGANRALAFTETKTVWHPAGR
jgi:acyl-CoA reductase-like NAD-dependent aldehyde dehydrogenase